MVNRLDGMTVLAAPTQMYGHPARASSFLEGHHKHAERAQQARVISRHAHRERYIEEMTEA